MFEGKYGFRMPSCQSAGSVRLHLSNIARQTYNTCTKQCKTCKTCNDNSSLDMQSHTLDHQNCPAGSRPHIYIYIYIYILCWHLLMLFGTWLDSFWICWGLVGIVRFFSELLLPPSFHPCPCLKLPLEDYDLFFSAPYIRKPQVCFLLLATTGSPRTPHMHSSSLQFYDFEYVFPHPSGWGC